MPQSTFGFPAAAHALCPRQCVVSDEAASDHQPLQRAPFEPFLLQASVAQMKDQARAQLTRPLQLSPTTLVYAAAAQNIHATCRYYVVLGEVIGFARLAQHHGPPRHGPPHRGRERHGRGNAGRHGLCLDVGSLRDGATTLLGVKDPLDVQLRSTARRSDQQLRLLADALGSLARGGPGHVALALLPRRREPGQHAIQAPMLDGGESCGRMNA